MVPADEEQKNKQYIEKEIFTNIIEILTCSTIERMNP